MTHPIFDTITIAQGVLRQYDMLSLGNPEALKKEFLKPAVYTGIFQDEIARGLPARQMNTSAAQLSFKSPDLEQRVGKASIFHISQWADKRDAEKRRAALVVKAGQNDLAARLDLVQAYLTDRFSEKSREERVKKAVNELVRDIIIDSRVEEMNQSSDYHYACAVAATDAFSIFHNSDKTEGIPEVSAPTGLDDQLPTDARQFSRGIQHLLAYALSHCKTGIHITNDPKELRRFHELSATIYSMLGAAAEARTSLEGAVHNGSTSFAPGMLSRMYANLATGLPDEHPLQILSAVPPNPPAAINRQEFDKKIAKAREYFQWSRPADAHYRFIQASEMDEHYHPAAIARAVCLHKLKNNKGALSILEQLEQNPAVQAHDFMHATVLMNKGICLIERGKNGAAEQALSRAYALHPNRATARALAEAYSQIARI